MPLHNFVFSQSLKKLYTSEYITHTYVPGINDFCVRECLVHNWTQALPAITHSPEGMEQTTAVVCSGTSQIGTRKGLGEMEERERRETPEVLVRGHQGTQMEQTQRNNQLLFSLAISVLKSFKRVNLKSAHLKKKSFRRQ